MIINTPIRFQTPVIAQYIIQLDLDILTMVLEFLRGWDMLRVDGVL